MYKSLASFLTVFLLFTGILHADDKVVNRIWKEIVPGNPSIWVDIDNMEQKDGVLSVAIKEKFGIPQTFVGYVTQRGVTVPLKDATSYVIAITHIKCDMSTYTVSKEMLFNVEDEAFFTYSEEEPIPTTINEDSPPAVVGKIYCKMEKPNETHT